MNSRTIEILVGLFVIAGLLALMALALKVSGFTRMASHHYYVITADFDNIGGLKVRAPVRVSGVTVGRVAAIRIDPQTFRATVVMRINESMENFPVDTTASIFTEGLLGSNYVNLSPGFEKLALRPGGNIQTTHSALILENLVGQLLFSLKSDKK